MTAVNRLLKHIGLLLVIFAGLLHPQDSLPVEITVKGGYQLPLDLRRADSGSGFGFAGQFIYRFDPAWRVFFNIAYDYMYLAQDDVIDEWNWAYWEDTYIPFLPGINVEEVNRTLRYDNGERAAVFEPAQRLKELRLSLGGAYDLAITEAFTAVLEFDFGISMFDRELRMTEHWTRRYILESEAGDTARYNYTYDLLHFAPSHKGTRFFAAPAAGLTYLLSDYIDLAAEIRYIQYLNRNDIQWLEDFFNIYEDSQQYFPLNSKLMINIGIRFRY